MAKQKKETSNLKKGKGTPAGKPREFKVKRKPKGTDITQKEIRDFKKKIASGEVIIKSRYLHKSKLGRDRIFAEPEDMIKAAEEYFAFVNETPFENWEWRNTATGLKKVSVPVRRPYSVGGAMLFFGVTDYYLSTFESERKKEIENPKSTIEDVAKAKSFLQVIQWIKACVREQKFDGAAVGHFNANIISRDLGLVDKVENTNIEKKSVADVFPDELKE